MICEDEALVCLCSDKLSEILWSNWQNYVPVRCERKTKKRKIGRLLEMCVMVYHAIAANPNRKVRAHQD